MSPILPAFLAVNSAALILMGWDKFKAGRDMWRISELALFLLPLLGGALGGTLGMLLFHHKTRKWYFAYGLPLLALAQMLLLLTLKVRGTL